MYCYRRVGLFQKDDIVIKSIAFFSVLWSRVNQPLDV